MARGTQSRIRHQATSGNYWRVAKSCVAYKLRPSLAFISDLFILCHPQFFHIDGTIKALPNKGSRSPVNCQSFSCWRRSAHRSVEEGNG